MRAAISFIKNHFPESYKLNGAEVGVEKGDHSEEILASLDIERIYLIDSWKPFMQEGCNTFNKQTTDNLYHLALDRFFGCKHVQLWREDSLTASKYIKDETLDFVYIDANHTYENVKEDISLWLPKVIPGGVVSGHDYHPAWPGVIRAVDELKEVYEVFTGTNIKDGILDWWFIKEEKKNENYDHTRDAS